MNDDAIAAKTFLDRLARLIDLYDRYASCLVATDARLIDRCITATHRDCIDYGAANAARPIMAAHQRKVWGTK